MLALRYGGIVKLGSSILTGSGREGVVERLTRTHATVRFSNGERRRYPRGYVEDWYQLKHAESFGTIRTLRFPVGGW